MRASNTARPLPQSMTWTGLALAFSLAFWAVFDWRLSNTRAEVTDKEDLLASAGVAVSTCYTRTRLASAARIAC